MRKTINISALIVFVWLLLDALNVFGMLLNFLLVGEIPGTSIVLSPTQMLAILTALTGLILLEVLASNLGVFQYIKRRITPVDNRPELPAHRLNRA